MKTNEIRNYLLNDRSAMDNKSIKLEYLEAATSDKKWDEFLLTNKYDDLLAAVKANPYERAHQAFRRDNASMIIKSTDKVAMTITFLDGETKKADRETLDHQKYRRLQKGGGGAYDYSATGGRGWTRNPSWTTKNSVEKTAYTARNNAETTRDTASNKLDVAKAIDLEKTRPTQKPTTGGGAGFGKGKSAGKGKGKGKGKKKD